MRIQELLTPVAEMMAGGDPAGSKTLLEQGLIERIGQFSGTIIVSDWKGEINPRLEVVITRKVAGMIFSLHLDVLSTGKIDPVRGVHSVLSLHSEQFILASRVNEYYTPKAIHELPVDHLKRVFNIECQWLIFTHLGSLGVDSNCAREMASGLVTNRAEYGYVMVSVHGSSEAIEAGKHLAKVRSAVYGNLDDLKAVKVTRIT